jgi:phosphoglycerate-specific signal transduction histidine kinase
MAPGRINQTRMQSPKAGQKSGWLSTIRGRLYLAFGFAASLTIIGSSIAFYEFTVIGLTTNEIAFRSLPTTTVSLRLAEQTTSLVSSGPRLMAAGTDAIRAEIIENIGKQEKNLEDGIAHLKKLGIAKADDIEASRKTLADRLQTLNEAVSHRIIMSTERAYLASSVRAAHEALLIGLAPAIDDANFDLMMGARQEGAAALDARLEYLRRLLETESESNLLAGLLTEASLVNDASRLEPLRDLIDSAQRKITKNLSAITTVPNNRNSRLFTSNSAQSARMTASLPHAPMSSVSSNGPNWHSTPRRAMPRGSSMLSMILSQSRDASRRKSLATREVRYAPGN